MTVHRLRLSTLVLVLTSLWIPARAAAQLVTGRAVDGFTSQGLPTTFIELVDVDDVVRATALTDGRGTFRMKAPAPGTYRVRAERIGYGAAESEPLEVTTERITQVTLDLQPEAVSIGGIEVEGEAECRVRPNEDGALVARLWDEVRKALTVTSWAQEASVLEYRLTRWRRTLDPQDLRVESEDRQAGRSFSEGSPFVSLPAEELQSEGYVQENPDGTFEYFAPDARTLLSDPFLDSHCFRVRQDEVPEEGWIGLEFEPIRAGDEADIRGVLWLDRETSELQRLRFWYTKLPGGLLSEKVGGTIVFDQVPEGPWIVRRWAIRMPIVELRAAEWQGSEREPYLSAVWETGGEITDVRTPEGSPLLGLEAATLVGTVVDTAAGTPVSGTTVGLAGTTFEARTDARGEFRMDSLPPGAYDLVYETGAGPAPAGASVELQPGESATVSIRFPPPAPEVEEVTDCQVTVVDDATGSLTGAVRTPSGEPVPEGTEVVVTWQVPDVDPSGNIRIDDVGGRVPVGGGGGFKICGIQAEEELTVRAEVDGRPAGEALTFRLTRNETRRIVVSVEPPPA